ncbi:peroxisomal 3-ketoacyl-CoA-thiolase [Protomyces lactucae-debilis]|uniref:acetyl-CoA C-acetyltransferase n=1 Tax=Protomyces lactucae-debilis TaxID=2754530 RepID=A0A1Y2FPD3_PROLT|nr:peroxisomal 3-ketoacyl-CoA-thiolase [Protomyces lactucae-debilis]ORY85457.1 peroxisomal 3-ketoacyl-CoA-thiolase [Protomyces lactucae-debilis]
MQRHTGSLLKTHLRSFSTSRPHQKLSDVVFLAAKRTPVAKMNGALKSKTAVELGTIAVKAALAASGLKPEAVEEVFMGQVIQANAGQSPARQVVLGAGMPTSTEASTINKVCASGMKSIMLAAQSISHGDRQVMIAGGMESMSNAPFYMPRHLTFGHVTANDSIVKDGLWDVYNNFAMGLCGEHCAETYNISREEQDAFAIESYKRAVAAWDAGKFKDEVVAVELGGRKGGVVTEDEEPRSLKLDKIPTLRPVFKREGGTVTAANASPLNDGASAVVLAHKSVAEAQGLTPMARMVGYADAALKPIDFTVAPAEAIKKVLAKTGLAVKDIAAWELNEAFAVVGIVNTKLLQLDPAKVNVNGGAVALGHPIGSSGSRIVVSLLHALKQGEYGCAAVCNGGGGSSAIIVQKM